MSNNVKKTDINKTINDILSGKNISEEQLFNLLKCVSENLNSLWDETYDLLKSYYNLKDNDEIEAINERVNIGIALSKLMKRNSLTKRLDSNKMGIKNFDYKYGAWEEKYAIAKKYYFEHGNLQVPARRIYKGVKLGYWLNNQKRNPNLSIERRNLLEQIAMSFEIKNREDEWQKYYDLAEKYYEVYGNLEISSKFVTNNGYEWADDGINLGNWMRNQRQNSQLIEERRDLLEGIGMIWHVAEEKNRVEALCTEYGIDISKNKDVLKYISYNCFRSKLLYLINNNIPVVNSFGYLHEIFMLNNKDIEERYDISTDDLLKYKEPQKVISK